MYCSPNIVGVIKSRRMRWTGHVACIGESRGVYRGLVGRPEGKRPVGRPRHRWEDNIKMDFEEVGCGGLLLSTHIAPRAWAVGRVSHLNASNESTQEAASKSCQFK